MDIVNGKAYGWMLLSKTTLQVELASQCPENSAPRWLVAGNPEKEIPSDEINPNRIYSKLLFFASADASR